MFASPIQYGLFDLPPLIRTDRGRIKGMDYMAKYLWVSHLFGSMLLPDIYTRHTAPAIVPPAERDATPAADNAPPASTEDPD